MTDDRRPDRRGMVPNYPRPGRCANCGDNRWRVVIIPAQDVALWECVTCHYTADPPRPTHLGKGQQ